jgi:uncharacterized membrane protein
VTQRPAARRAVRFSRPRRRIRANLAQLLFAVAGLGLGLLLPRITVAPTVASSRVTETLIGVGFGVLGLVTIIFSLLFLVVQWAFSSLSPRLNLFRDDPIVWRTFGLAVGVFVFSVTAALVIGNDTEVSVIVPAAEVAGVLAAIALIRALQVKAFASIQLAPTLSAIAARGRGILDELYPGPARTAALPPPTCRRCAGTSPGRTSRPSCSNLTCAGSRAPLAALSSSFAPGSATRSRTARWSPACTAAMPATRRSWPGW